MIIYVNSQRKLECISAPVGKPTACTVFCRVSAHGRLRFSGEVGGWALTRATGRLLRNSYAITHSQTNTSWERVATTVYDRASANPSTRLARSPLRFRTMLLDRWLKLAAESARGGSITCRVTGRRRRSPLAGTRRT